MYYLDSDSDLVPFKDFSRILMTHYTHAHYTYIHTYIHTCLHIYVYTCVDMNAYIHICAFPHIFNSELLLIVTGQELRCDVIVDEITQMHIETTTKELFLDDSPEEFIIRARNDKSLYPVLLFS